jgi:hypothetical protein
MAREAAIARSEWGAEMTYKNVSAVPQQGTQSEIKRFVFSWLRKFSGSRIKCWVCHKLCGDTFTNADASREIDRLTIENEQLRNGGRA